MSIRRFFSDDIFISYARKDSSTYVTGLADKLTSRGFACFTDRLGTEASSELPASLRRDIRDSTLLVVVGTSWSGTRTSIKDEIVEFRKTNRPIIPIDIDESIYKAIWYKDIEGIAPEKEINANALADGEVSATVVARIEKAFIYRRRNERLRRLTIGTLAVLVLLVVASVVAGYVATRKLAEAAQATDEARRAKDEAATAKNEALTAKTEAEAARLEANRAQSEANKQKQLADEATAEAKKQTQLADIATNRAREAAANAERQQGIAVGRQAMTSASSLRARSLQKEEGWADLLQYGTLLSIESARRLSALGIAPAESNESLRESLTLLPRAVRKFEHNVEDALITPDGKYLIGKDGDFVRVWETQRFSQVSENIKLESQNLTFNHDRTLLAALGNDKSVSIWELPKGKLLWKTEPVDELTQTNAAHSPQIPMRFSSDGEYLIASVTTQVSASGGNPSKNVVVWDARRGRRITEVKYEGELVSLAVQGDQLALSLIPAGQKIRETADEAVEMENIVQIWELKNLSASATNGAVKTNNQLRYTITTKTDLEPLYALTFSPDGRLLAGTSGSAASIVEVGCGKQFTPIEGLDFAPDTVENEFIYKIDFSPDGKFIAVFGEDLTADTWDVITGRKVKNGTFNTEGWAYERSYIANHDETGVRVTDVRNGRDVGRVLRDESAAELKLADYASEANLLVLIFDNTIMLYDTVSAQETARVTYSPTAQISKYSADRRFVALTEGPRIILWDTLKAREVARLEHGGKVSQLVFSPDGTLLASASEDDTVRIWATSDGHEIWRMDRIPHLARDQSVVGRTNVESMGFSPHARFFVLETFNDALRVWEVNNRRQVAHASEGPFNLAELVAFTADEKLVALPTKEGVRVFSTANGSQVSSLPAANGAVVFSKDNARMAHSLKGTLEVSEFSGRTYRVPVAGKALDYDFSPDGKFLVTVSGSGGEFSPFEFGNRKLLIGKLDQVQIWEATTGRLVAHLKFETTVNSFEFSPSGKYLVTFNEVENHYAKDVGIWELATGRRIARSLPNAEVRRVVFSTDEKYAATAGPDASVRVFNLNNATEVAELIHGGSVNDVAFSAHARYIATASDDRRARVWEIGSWREVARLTHDGGVMLAAFEAGGDQLATVSNDLTARVWILPEDELIRRACDRVMRPLTLKEWRHNFGVEKYGMTCANLRPAR